VSPNKALVRKLSGLTTILLPIRTQTSGLPAPSQGKNRQPPATKDAKKFRAVGYQRVDRMLSQMKGCLADGFPFVFGFTVYDSFESAEVARTGALQMPKPRKELSAVMLLLPSATTTRPSVSWCATHGALAGQKRLFHHALLLLTHRQSSDDFWTIRLVH